MAGRAARPALIHITTPMTKRWREGCDDEWTIRLFLFGKTQGEDPIYGALFTEDGKQLKVWSICEFICVASGRGRVSPFGRTTYAALDKRLRGRVSERAVSVSIRGELTPAMTAEDLRWLLLALKNDDYARAFRTFHGLARFDGARNEFCVAEARRRAPPPLGAGEKFQVYLFRRKYDEDPVRGMMHEGEMHWSVYDFLCVMSGKSVATNYGRVYGKRLDERNGGAVKARSVRLPINERGKPTLAMSTAELRQLLFALETDALPRARKAYDVLTEVFWKGTSASVAWGNED